MARENDPKKTPSDKPDFSNVQSGSSSTAPSPSPPRPAPTADNPLFTTYTVQRGDNLSKIAKREYGSAREWKKIFEANRDVIKDPDLIYPGQELRIPKS